MSIRTVPNLINPTLLWKTRCEEEYQTKSYSLSDERLYIFASKRLSADQGKNGDPECEQCQDDGWNRQAKRLQAIQKKEQY
jgi:hypothetical protein